MASSEPGSEAEEWEPGLTEGDGAVLMAHEELPGDENEAAPGPSGLRRVGREEEGAG